MKRPAAAQAAETVLLTNVRLPAASGPDQHPGSGQGREPVDLLIRDGVLSRVRAAGEFDSSEAQWRHDAAGRTVLPGLWDHHVHFTQWVISQGRAQPQRPCSWSPTLCRRTTRVRA